MIHPLREAQLSLQTRRAFLSSVGQFSLGAIALHAMQADALGASSANDNPLAPTPTQRPYPATKPTTSTYDRVKMRSSRIISLRAPRQVMSLLSFATSSVIMLSSLRRFSRRLASKTTTRKTGFCSRTLHGNY